jgi:hypothetical protein
MMERETGGPAFAASGHPAQQHVQQEGMTLRDYFAASALNGMCSDFNMLNGFKLLGKVGSKSSSEIAAESAYQMADAMLKARAISKATGE